MKEHINNKKNFSFYGLWCGLALRRGFLRRRAEGLALGSLRSLGFGFRRRLGRAPRDPLALERREQAPLLEIVADRGQDEPGKGRARGVLAVRVRVLAICASIQCAAIEPALRLWVPLREDAVVPVPRAVI